MLSALLFDLDGTLTDTNRLHAESFAASIAERGYVVPVERILQRLGEGGSSLVQHVLGPGISPEEAEAIATRHSELYRSRLRRDGTTLLPGAVRLLHLAKAQNLKLGLCTSSTQEELKRTAEAAELDLSLFDAITTASDVDEAKPAAQPVQVVAEKLNVHPAETALVGDTPFDGGSARRAGSVFLAVGTGPFSAEELRRAGARQVYATPNDLADHLFDALDLAAPGPQRLTQHLLERLLDAALNEAEWALQEGNLPIGAVVARRDGSIISRAGNAVRQRGLAIAHAELEALLLAAPLPSPSRDFVLATTLEPCRMCLGAALEQGFDTVAYGLNAPENGGVNTVEAPASGSAVLPRLVGGIHRDRARGLFESFLRNPPRRASEPQLRFTERLLNATA